MAGRVATDAIIRGKCAISVNDPGHPVPQGWQRVPLTDVAELGTGHTPSRLHPEYWDGDIAWIGIRDAGSHHGQVINDTAQHVTELGLANSAARLLPKDTICLSRTASVGYVVKMGKPMATSQDFVTWSCGDQLDPNFLHKALVAEGEEIRRFGEGSTHTTIYFPEVKAFHIDLPPLAEQRRIVGKLDALTARLARARAELKRVLILSEEFRNNAQHLAFSGELTRDWRGGSNEPWRYEALSDVADVVTGSTPPTAEKQALFGGPHAFFKPTDLDAGYNVIHPRETLSDEGFARSRRAPPGTTLMTCIGATISKAGFARVPCTFNQQINAAIPKAHKVVPEWLYWALTSPQFRQLILDNSSATTMPIINKGRFQNLGLGVPSLAEQREIVRRLEATFAHADRLEAEAARARALLDRLEAAILAKAFRGELVPQDPADEPASVLLDRIRAERTASQKPRRARRSQPSPA